MTPSRARTFLPVYTAAMTLLACGAWPCSTAQAEAATTTGALYGFHMDISYEADEAQREAIIAADASVGAEIGRNTFSMALLQPSPGEYDWSRIDSIIADMRSASIERLFVVSGSPAWANFSLDPFEVPQTPELFDLWVADYADFMGVAAARYPGQMWELGNEPNENYFWKPWPDSEQYVRWYSALRDAIKQADPTAKVSVGGLTGLGASCCIKGIEFLRQVVATGVPIDYVAIHPYTQFAPDQHVKFEQNFDDIGAVHDLLEGMGRVDVPLWITEWGWGAEGADPETLARYMTDSLTLIRDRYRYVTVATYFDDVDSSAYGYGVFDRDMNPRPSALAFERFVSVVSSK